MDKLINDVARIIESGKHRKSYLVAHDVIDHVKANQDYPSILERLMDDLSFMAEVFEYIKAEKIDANYTLNFKEGKLHAITKENK